MRISDWSSDVCSSDLRCTGTTDLECFSERLRGLRGLVLGNTQLTPVPHEGGVKISGFGQSVPRGVRDAFYIGLCLPEVTTLGRGELQLRSEEHTSELQSLMRISYAVFCLKKKKHRSQLN